MSVIFGRWGHQSPGFMGLKLEVLLGHEPDQRIFWYHGAEDKTKMVQTVCLFAKSFRVVGNIAGRFQAV